VSVTRMPREDVKWVGLDVAKDAIAVGVLNGSSESAPRLEKIAHDEVSIRRLVSRLGEPARLRACYEAGPTGYELHRLLRSMGVGCEVVAPSPQNSTTVLDRPSAGCHHPKHSTRRCVDHLSPQAICAVMQIGFDGRPGCEGRHALARVV
jgi:hypothetical protein